MHYVMSDIHGCHEKYRKLLKKIEFSEKDTLYILGDVVDRGAEGIRVLLDIAGRENVVLFRGNHDQTALGLLQKLSELFENTVSPELIEAFQLWLSDGGQATLQEFMACTVQEQETALKILRSSRIYQEVTVNDTGYFLAHTVPEKEQMLASEQWDNWDFLMGEPDYETVYYPDKIIVTGHTPTGLIDPAFQGKIWRGNRHIAVDCGAVFGNPLGCLRLEDGAEFYA